MMEELLEVFVEDLRDNLILLDEGLMMLRNGNWGQEVLNNIFRVSHTIKGNSAAMDFMRIEHVMHSMEDILQAVRNGERGLTENIIDLLYQCHDFLEDCIEVVARDHSDTALGTDKILNLIEQVTKPEPEEHLESQVLARDQLGFDKELIEVITANCQRGYTAYELAVIFAPACLMKTVRAWMVFESVSDHAILVYSHPERPSEEIFRNPNYNFDSPILRMVVLSEQEIEPLVESIAESSEIEKVTFRAMSSINEIEALTRQIRLAEEVLNQLGDLETVLLDDDTTTVQVQTLITHLVNNKNLSFLENHPMIGSTAATVASLLRDSGKHHPRLTREQKEALASLAKVWEKCIKTSEPLDEQVILHEVTACLELLETDSNQEQRVGEILVEKGLLKEQEVKDLLEIQKATHPDLKFGQVAVKENILSAYEVMTALNDQQKVVPKKAPGTKSESGFIRVPVLKVDTLMDMLGELLILNSQLEQSFSDVVHRENGTVTVLSRTAKLIKVIQALSMSLRMVEIRPTLHRLTRIVRDTAAELNKRVSVVLEGEETEIDRSAMDRLFDPLMHLVRNAVSHGIEDEEQRLAMGKKGEGQVTIRCYNKRGSVYIEVVDDGRGMNTKVILDKARELKMAEEHREYSEDEILRFIFQPGFSTQEQINSISGRGVGMNVVEEDVHRTGGKVDIINRPGLGCTFVLRIPMNLAVINGTIVEVAGGRYIIPTLFIKEFFVAEESNWVRVRGELNAVRLRDTVVPVLWPGRLFGTVDEQEYSGRRELVIMEMEQRLLAFPVKRIVTRQELVAKPLIEDLNDIGFASGASILGDGTVSLILDVEAIFKMADRKLVNF